jgi:hypothetical protein
MNLQPEFTESQWRKVDDLAAKVNALVAGETVAVILFALATVIGNVGAETHEAFGSSAHGPVKEMLTELLHNAVDAAFNVTAEGEVLQ